MITELPVVAAVDAIVTALTVLTVGTAAVVCDPVVNVVGIAVLSVKHTDENMMQRYNVKKFYFQLLHGLYKNFLNFNVSVTNSRGNEAH